MITNKRRLLIGFATLVLATTLLLPRPTVATTVTALLTGLNNPVSFKFAPDGRIFYDEKDTGNIRVILQDGTLLQQPFATVSSIFNGGEAGLLGIALDPDFQTNWYVYVYHNYRDANSYTSGNITRYTSNGNIGISPVNILHVVSYLQNTIYHNGGYIKFGPDGDLYAQVGEFHQSQQAQNQSSNDGKMLRIRPDGSFPSDNPSPGSPIYASGIRNAFGFDFDTTSNRLIATEAGPSTDDEINIIVKGGNYGWPICTGPCHTPPYIDPVVDLNPVVTPTGIATVAPNVYYFGEWNTGNLMRLELTSAGALVSMDQVFSFGPGGITGVEKRSNGGLYFSTPNGIYTYDLGTPNTQSPPQQPSPYLFYLAGLVVATSIVSIILLTRKKWNRTPSETLTRKVPGTNA